VRGILWGRQHQLLGSYSRHFLREIGEVRMHWLDACGEKWLQEAVALAGEHFGVPTSSLICVFLQSVFLRNDSARIADGYDLGSISYYRTKSRGLQHHAMWEGALNRCTLYLGSHSTNATRNSERRQTEAIRISLSSGMMLGIGVWICPWYM
jgi:hypothetical protein